MKMFEEFMQAEYELDQIMNKVKDRITYWFQNGSFSMSSAPIDSKKSATTGGSQRSITTNFADADFYFQLIIRFTLEDLENCDVIIKKYDPSKIDEPNGGQPIWTVELTNDKQVKIDDIKEDFIIQKISEQDDNTKENPDENKIEVPKDKEKKPAQGAAPAAPGAEGAAPGGMPPPVQGAAPAFPQPAAPPAQGAAPPTL